MIEHVSIHKKGNTITKIPQKFLSLPQKVRGLGVTRKSSPITKCKWFFPVKSLYTFISPITCVRCILFKIIFFAYLQLVWDKAGLKFFFIAQAPTAKAICDITFENLCKFMQNNILFALLWNGWEMRWENSPLLKFQKSWWIERPKW